MIAFPKPGSSGGVNHPERGAWRCLSRCLGTAMEVGDGPVSRLIPLLIRWGISTMWTSKHCPDEQNGLGGVRQCRQSGRGGRKPFLTEGAVRVRMEGAARVG